ncbi:MAG: leucine-rich repeat domain-containing protein [Silvanigrellales bacterium]|nr:leucine-rich repeat domain-containing protein [Silvanigrellales bacterium]
MPSGFRFARVGRFAVIIFICVFWNVSTSAFPDMKSEVFGAGSSRDSQASFLALCTFRTTLSKERRATVEAILLWARTKQQARSCFAASRALAQTETVEVEDAGLTWAEPFREARSARRLYLAGNDFLDTAFLSNLSALEVLDLRESPITSLPDDVAARLQVLNVSGTRISSLTTLAAASGLLDLNAHGLGLTSLEGLEHFPALVSLGLADNHLTSLHGIEVAKELRSLYVTNNAITDLTPAASLPFLRLLNARGNPLSPPAVCPHETATCIFDSEQAN